MSILIELDEYREWTDFHGQRDRYSSVSRGLFLGGTLPMVAADILILEDRRFFKHRGAELRAVPRALRRWLVYGRLGGISTVEQQLVRIIRRRRERTWRRKGGELFFAVLINFHRSKLDILLAYLNCSYFGPHLNGVDTASLICFGMPARELSPDKSAFIASLLPYPMPSKVSAALRHDGPANDPFEIFEAAASTHPWWVKRIKMRMRYLEDLRPRYSKLYEAI
ncbi:hypothetical protein E0K89_021490 [Aquicoccus sp. SCR17]|nr:hypothetical protein [Carideicomes alvinocaridis]